MKKQITVEVELDIGLHEVFEDDTMEGIVNKIVEYDLWIGDWDFTILLLTKLLEDTSFTSMHSKMYGTDPIVEKLKSEFKRTIKEMEGEL